MGFIRASVGALGGALADQWIDYLTVPQNLPQTAALFPAVRRGRDQGRGSNVKGSEAVITNGSRIVVPEGYGLLTFQEGEITSFVAEPGAYIWDSSDPVSQSLFADGGFVHSVVKQSWQRFKFGGRPASQQAAFFVSLKELPHNRFGTQSPVYWDDTYLRAQVGATARGTYTLRIVDPIVFVKNVISAQFLQGWEVFDFTEPANDFGQQLFSEVIASLSAAFSSYTNDSSGGSRITRIQADSVGFSSSLSSAIESGFHWSRDRGIAISSVAIVAIEYDQATLELLKTVQRADALSGNRGNANLQASVAAGLEAAGSTDGSAGLIGLGIATNGIGLGSIVQPVSNPQVPTPSVASDSRNLTDGGGSDLVDRLAQLKRAFDAGLISESEFESARLKALGL